MKKYPFNDFGYNKRDDTAGFTIYKCVRYRRPTFTTIFHEASSFSLNDILRSKSEPKSTKSRSCVYMGAALDMFSILKPVPMWSGWVWDWNYDYIWICITPNPIFLLDDVIKWKPFPRSWPFVRGIHRSPVNSPRKGQWCGTLMLSVICAWINGCVNNREAGDSRRNRAHYDVTVMKHECINYSNLLQ